MGLTDPIITERRGIRWQATMIRRLLNLRSDRVLGSDPAHAFRAHIFW
jgi:hypothetical protein